jgi:hypothetical protein
VRVVVGPEAPPAVVVGVVLVDVVVVAVGVVAVELVRGAVVVPVCAGSGVLATDTVFVPPPQPPNTTPAGPRISVSVKSKPRLIALMIFAARRPAPRP